MLTRQRAGQWPGLLGAGQAAGSGLKINAWARDFGQARELGTYRNSCRAAHGSMRTGWGIFLIGLGLLPGLAFVSAAPAQLRAAVAGVVGALIVLGVALIKTAPREKVDWIFQYAGGIAQVIEGEAVPRVVPWGLLGHVLKEYSDGSGDTDPSLLAVHVFGVDGTVITAGAKYGGGRLERDVDGVVVAMRLPAAIERYQSGAPVLFGDLSVSQDEIAWADGAKRAAWRDIRSVRVQPYQIDLNASAWKTGQKSSWMVSRTRASRFCSSRKRRPGPEYGRKAAPPPCRPLTQTLPCCRRPT